MAADTIKLPGAGPVNRKVVLVAGAVGLGVVGYAWWTRKPEIPEEVVTEGELDAIGDERIPTTGVPYDSTIGGPDTGITTNGQWTQFATDRLNSLGYDPIAVGDALGRFLDHQSLSAADANIARAAMAQAGPPPQGGPWNVLTEGPVTPPASVGMPAPILTSTLPAYRNGAWEYTISWAPVPGATRYWFQHVGGSSGYITATKSSTIRAAAGRVDTWKFAGVNAAGVKGPEATLAKSLPPAPAVAGARKPAPPASLGLLPLGPARFGMAWKASAGATGYRYRWYWPGHSPAYSAWSAVTPRTTVNVTWRFPRGARVYAQVIAGNKGGWSAPRGSNIATAQ